MSLPLTPSEKEFLEYNASIWNLAMGPMYFGTGIDMLCLGVILCQFVFWKVRLEREERWPLRSLIYWITVGSVAHTAFVQAYGMSVFVTGYGDPINIFRGWWVKGDCLFELLVAMPIEVLYAVRAYQLWGRPKVIRYGLPFVFICSVAVGIANLVLGEPDPLSSTTSRYFISWVATLFTIDWLLSGLIIIALIRKRSGVAHTDRLVMRIVILSAEAQLIPSLVTAGLIIKALVAPKSLIVLVFIFVPKVWVITAMIVINSRKELRHVMEQERERRQNTLNFMSDEVLEDGNGTTRPSISGFGIFSTASRPEETVQTSSAKGLMLPRLSLTSPGTELLSPISEKTVDSPEVEMLGPSTGTYFAPLAVSLPAPASPSRSVPKSPDQSQGVDIFAVPPRRVSEPESISGTASGPGTGSGLSLRSTLRRIERRGSGGLGYGAGLGRLRSRGTAAGASSSLGGVEDEAEEGMSFEEMLGLSRGS